MKRKELKALATKIAKSEYVIQTSSDPKVIRKAQDDIMDLSGRVQSLEDMVIIDELVSDMLEKMLEK